MTDMDIYKERTLEKIMFMHQVSHSYMTYWPCSQNPHAFECMFITTFSNPIIVRV